VSVVLAPPAEGSLGRAIAISLSSQALARVAHLVLNVVTTLALVRYLGPGGYGQAVLVFSVAGVFSLVGDFGLTKLGVREAACEPATVGTVIGTVVGLRLALAVAAAGGAQLALLAVGADRAARLGMLVLSISFLTEALLSVVIVFHLTVRQQYEAFIRVVMEVVELAVVAVLIAASGSLVALMAAPVAGAAVGAVLALVCARRRFGLRMSFSAGRARKLARETVYVGPAALLGIAYLKVDSVVLGALRPSRDVGIYGAAYQPIEYLLLCSAILVNVLFPLLSAWSETDRDRFVRLYRRGSDALVALTLPVPILAGLAGPSIVETVLESRYADSAGVLRLLSVALLFMVVHSWQSYVLLAAGQQRVLFRCMGAALILNAVLDVVLVSAFGYTGAGVAALVTSAAVCWWTTRAMTRLAHASLDRASLARVLIAAVVMAAAGRLVLLAGLAWPVAAVAGLVAYVAALQRLGVANPAVLRSLVATGGVQPHHEVLAP
jgi:O-antigen/teichoic acid export membrane protein